MLKESKKANSINNLIITNEEIIDKTTNEEIIDKISAISKNIMKRNLR